MDCLATKLSRAKVGVRLTEAEHYAIVPELKFERRGHPPRRASCGGG